MAQLLITGAAGAIGTALRHRFTDLDLILTDVVQLPSATKPNEQFVLDATTDVDRFSDLAEGSDLVVHLGWVREPRQDFGVLQENIGITHRVLEGARRADVGRFLFASSNHAVGYTPVADVDPDADVATLPMRPDDFYGVAKAACEALCAFYADEYAMTVVSARILSFRTRPAGLRELSTWLSPDDCARLVRAAANLDAPGHHVCWGVSGNTRRWAALGPGQSIAFNPQDDAEPYADAILAAATEGDAATLSAVGGRVAPWAHARNTHDDSGTSHNAYTS